MKNSHPHSYALVTFSALSALIFSSASFIANSAKAVENNQSKRTSETSSAPSDAQIAKIVMTINKSEVKEAEHVKDKSKNPEIQRFADHMLRAHEASNDRTEKLTKNQKIKPQDSDMSRDLEQKSKQSLSELKRQDTAQLDSAYLSAQVQEHQETLSTLNQLLPQARNPELKSLIRQMRPEVEGHLKEAKQLQASLSSSSASG